MTDRPSSSSTLSPVQASPAQATVVLKVSHMTCKSCVQSVETLLLQQPGVISAIVDLTTSTAIVKADAAIDPAQLTQPLIEAGFPSHPVGENANTAQAPVHWTAMAFYILVVFFNFCLNVQVLTVGLAYFHNPVWWNAHVWLVRSYSGLSLILLVGVHSIPCPRRVRSLTASIPVLLILQFLTIHLKTTIPLAIVHPLIGFTLFSVSTTLVHRVSRFLFPKGDEDDQPMGTPLKVS